MSGRVFNFSLVQTDCEYPEEYKQHYWEMLPDEAVIETDDEPWSGSDYPEEEPLDVEDDSVGSWNEAPDGNDYFSSSSSQNGAPEGDPVIDKAFIEALVPHGVPTGTLLATNSKGGHDVKHHTSIDSVITELESLTKWGRDAYINPALRVASLETKKRGGNKDLVCVQAVSIDIDYQAEGHADSNLLTKDELWAILDRMEHKPSFTIDSGGGFYLVYLLDEPLMLRTDGAEDSVREEEKLAEAKALFQLLVDYFKEVYGLKAENATPSASLRVPGTLNFKRSTEGELVTLASATGMVYSAEELKQAFTVTPVQRMVSACAFFQDAKANPGDVTYPNWFAAGSNLACAPDQEEGRRTWHAVSMLDPERYDEQKCEEQWNQFNKGDDGSPVRCQNITMVDGSPCPLMGPNGRCTLPDGGLAPAALMNWRGSENGSRRVGRISAVSASAIDAMDIPPIKSVVQDLISEGLTMLSGASKVGKSWMSLDIGLSVANGERVSVSN